MSKNEITNNEKQKDLLKIPAGEGISTHLKAGQHIRIINTYGTQTVDTWAIIPNDEIYEYLSMGCNREVIKNIYFKMNDTLITNTYRPILEIIDDTTLGLHDNLIPACSPEMYKAVGIKEYHKSCAENFRTSLKKLGEEYKYTPQPWNLFMNVILQSDGKLEFKQPVSKAGDYIELQAKMDCIMVFSSCPDDYYPTNGGDGSPRDAHIKIF